jgi:hypothetical protein
MSLRRTERMKRFKIKIKIMIRSVERCAVKAAARRRKEQA